MELSSLFGLIEHSENQNLVLLGTNCLKNDLAPHIFSSNEQ
jgi:hypothetical protein